MSTLEFIITLIYGLSLTAVVIWLIVYLIKELKK